MAPEEVNKPPSLPPYPEMIVKALESLDESGGSNKSAISKYIESTYGELPEDHSDLLLLHLNKMKDSGELVFWKNNYMKPDPNAPPRRGRGRPPKPKDPMPPSTVLSPPRPRGRPPKDPNAPPKAKVSSTGSGSGRPRGRPKKIARSSAVAPPPPSASAAAPSGRPRGRGRPPKVKPQLTEVSVES
ncbi:HMG-Y-related protein A-like [Gastrolobium bilobum]|uniref:HMG-Y-related protein A-like n=1 Tax=Gastrolobium bilobum TaxID=150636 RepID=UPI002AB2257E|nr:HMG-Y-related protein A-like [Gastrolobium bilobum]XP_061349360.1 HMG-Y-related protein A-like [Gastrolobium bilobum]